jgi:hypothetical protein
MLVLAFACSKTAPPEPAKSEQQRHREQLELRVKELRPHATEQRSARELARALIELSRVTSEPALRDEAERVIERWASAEPPDAEALILRATIRQSRHEFPQALVDLQRALKLAPANAQAWITLSTILGVRGEHEAALKACPPLASAAHRLAHAGCEANILGVSGRAQEAREKLEAALKVSGEISAAETSWALSMIAEICGRQGDLPCAEENYARARALGVRDEYLLASEADYLLDREKYAEVVRLLEREANIDPLLLRLALAEKKLGSSLGVKHGAMIGAVYAQNRARRDNTHRREEARYELELGENIPEALRLARENFEVQREPADVRILLSAALAARDRAAAEPALQFLEKSKLEDVAVQKLAEALRALPEAGKQPFEKLAGNLFGQLGAEAETRVEGTPHFEDLLKAVRAQGIEAQEGHQSLAATVRAKYCASSLTKSGVGFTVCEYADRAALENGKKTALNYPIAHRTLLENKSSLLVMLQAASTEAAKKDAAAITAEFLKL